MATKAQLKKLRVALNKLTSGQTLTPDERAILNLSPAPTPAVTPSITPSASETQFGPLGGLSSGAVAGVLAPTGYDKKGKPTGVTGTPATGADALVAGGGTFAPGAGPAIVTPPAPPGDTGPTLALETFKNTLALYFGKEEMSQAWVAALYGAVSKFYKTGSTVDESLNLALQDVRNNPELATFTKRFKGLYDLQDKLVSGMAVNVPTIAQFFKSQQQLGEVMNRAGFADLATQEFLGNVLGTGKSVAETTALINEVFMAIDNAPEQLKRDLAMVAPGADRTSIAKALLLGSQGAAALKKQIADTTVFSAARSQGLNIDMTTAGDYAARGFGYNQSLTNFGNVARGRAPLEKLTEISTGAAVTPEQAQKTLQQSIFENNVAAQEQIRLESEREAARYGGRAGTIGSRSLASRNRANRAI
jgi:hypothetical protein